MRLMEGEHVGPFNLGNPGEFTMLELAQRNGRCIHAVIAGREYVRLEREYHQIQALSNGHAGQTLDPEMQSHVSVEASIKSAMQVFVKFYAGIILDSWSEANRSHMVAKLIFLDQLCEISPFLPRSSLEPHVPYAILRSIYSHLVAIQLCRLQYSSNDSGYFYDPSSGSIKSSEGRHWNVRLSGPLDYNSSRSKV
ncbi:hypothetical protein Pint_26559 [Pistacia integerrima]|uniref:Uncharacterized protein n=1 Tax=Pistacia integerrima TaxID=434235 RepID=A0ACC0YN04_9ROSI|nr:hypothetical protein Pint_26559 [Pistacia integerrima]